MVLYGGNFLEMKDLSSEQLFTLLELAKRLKIMQKEGKPHRYLEGKTLAMIFEKQSTRTRVSFEAGMFQLGGHALYLSSQDLQIGRGETIADTARVLSGYVDAVMARTFAHSTLTTLAQYATIPVINGLSDLEHPVQILADLLTIWEEKGKLEGLKVTYVGDGNNVANSLLIGCATAGVHVSLACPEGYRPDERCVKIAEEIAKKTRATIQITSDPREAAKQADVLYTDVWVSMGQEKEAEKRLKIFKPYQINSDLLRAADRDCVILHCLPAHRGQEITEEAMEGEHSRIFQEAENRLHTQKALLTLLLCKHQEKLPVAAYPASLSPANPEG